MKVLLFVLLVSISLFSCNSDDESTLENPTIEEIVGDFCNSSVLIPEFESQLKELQFISCDTLALVAPNGIEYARIKLTAEPENILHCDVVNIGSNTIVVEWFRVRVLDNGCDFEFELSDEGELHSNSESLFNDLTYNDLMGCYSIQ